MYLKTVLDNQLRIVTNEMPNARSATIAIYLGVGSRYENDAEGGISHFIEHMLFKGTDKYPTAREVSEAIEGVGGVMNAGTAKEYTVYWTKVPSFHFETAMEVLSDILLHSKFRSDDVERERQVIVEEWNMTFDSPSDLVTDRIDELVWDRQPIGRNVLGSLESIKSISRDDLVHFKDQHYAPNHMVVSVAGQIEHDRVVEMITEKFGSQKPSSIMPPTVARNEQVQPKLDLYFKETEQANFCVAVPGLPYTHPDRFVQSLMDTVLGHGMSSRLFLNIREKQGLAYDVHSYSNQYRDIGSEVVYAGVDTSRVEASVSSVLNELASLRREPVPAAELTKAKEYSKGRLVLGLEDSRGMATWSGAQELLQGSIMTVEEVMRLIDEVSASDIQRLADRMFVDEQISLAVVGPYKDEAPFRELLTFSDGDGRD
ncbi:MAG: insulinase family protein [Chloroflexi bacterium]|nr:insulinase family protein [Chloroflexota bacterium]